MVSKFGTTFADILLGMGELKLSNAADGANLHIRCIDRDGIMANHSVVTIQNGTLEEEIDELEEPPPTNRTNVCQISATEFTINFYIQTSICFVGFVLNMINVAVFLQPKFSGAAYAYMTAMSLADAITLLNNLPSGLLR
ncbi:uncharacterized protein DEA37_0004899 [Paragonimus westermani]|uniref:G-protein coupled receptors family 1 profile domain-containing protein n=1 Tax=Paragonimus westermani TaxID=34504 RepID=A0A5J4NNF3_9TREM|nr:uncharacterized protein DEA37_0004899 [Paragonimus westermani]